jgi:TolA-binding protein
MSGPAIKLLATVALCGALASISLADEAEDQFAIAASHYSAKRWDMAIDGFRKFLHDNPDHVKHGKALFFEAESLVQLGRYADASPLFLDVIADEPAGPHARQALFRVAEAAVKCGKTDEAQLRLTQFQTKYPSDKLNASVLMYQGNLLLRAGDAASAEQCFRQSVERFGELWEESQGELLGDARVDATLALAVYEGPPTDAGPQIVTTSGDYIDAPVVFRQYCCPGCWTALYSAVVPADHPDNVSTLSRLVGAAAG